MPVTAVFILFRTFWNVPYANLTQPYANSHEKIIKKSKTLRKSYAQPTQPYANSQKIQAYAPTLRKTLRNLTQTHTTATSNFVTLRADLAQGLRTTLRNLTHSCITARAQQSSRLKYQ